MHNLVNPRNARPEQPRAIQDAYRMLGGAPKKRRGTPASAVHVDRLDAGGLDTELLSWMFFSGSPASFPRR
jgi:hypothetical protein